MAPCSPAHHRYHTYLSRTRANTSYDTPISISAAWRSIHVQHAPLCNPRNRSASWCLCRYQQLQAADPQHTTPREPKRIHSPRTPSASGSSVPPCPTFTLPLRAALFLPTVFSSFSFSTKRRELQTSFFNWSTTCIDVGPDGFITPK